MATWQEKSPPELQETPLRTDEYAIRLRRTQHKAPTGPVGQPEGVRVLRGINAGIREVTGG